VGLIAIGAGMVIGQEAAIWCICVGLSLTAVQFAKSRRSNPVATTIALTAVCAVIGLAGGLYIAASWLKLPPETPGFFLIRNVVPPELPRIATSVNVVALEKLTPSEQRRDAIDSIRGLLDQGSGLAPAYQQTAGTHFFSSVQRTIEDWREGAGNRLLAPPLKDSGAKEYVLADEGDRIGIPLARLGEVLRDIDRWIAKSASNQSPKEKAAHSTKPWNIVTK